MPHDENTAYFVQAAAAGARGETGLDVALLRAAEAGARDLLGADGFIFATPENLAAISGKMKDFFDRTYYEALDRLNGRPYATLVCAGSDGRNAAQQVARAIGRGNLTAQAHFRAGFETLRGTRSGDGVRNRARHILKPNRSGRALGAAAGQIPA